MKISMISFFEYFEIILKRYVYRTMQNYWSSITYNYDIHKKLPFQLQRQTNGGNIDVC